MGSWNPPRVEQNHWSGFDHWNGLADAIDPMIKVRRIDIEMHHSGIRNISWLLYRRRHRRWLRSSARALGVGQAGQKEENNV